MKTNKGFSLVELIVVIAIMAIIAAVAVPVYNVYIDKANKAADEQLVSDIESSVNLALASNEYTLNDSVVIKLSPTAGAQVISASGNTADVTFVQGVLEDAFGSEWTTLTDELKLAYGGWEARSDSSFVGIYEGTSYNGNEGDLFEQIGSLTNLLKDTVSANPNVVGDSFRNFYETTLDLGEDATNQEIANAAVLYAADKVSSLDETGKNNVLQAFEDFYDSTSASYGNVGVLTLTLKDELHTFGAMAAIYAHAEAFVQYSGDAEMIATLHNADIDTDDSEQALNSVANALGAVVQKASTEPEKYGVYEYIGTEQYLRDVEGYIAAMGVVNKNADAISGSLDDAGCYTDGTVENLLQSMVTVGSLGALNAGEVAISVFPNGVIVSDPMDYLS